MGVFSTTDVIYQNVIGFWEVLVSFQISLLLNHDAFLNLKTTLNNGAVKMRLGCERCISGLVLVTLVSTTRL
jgi:hypothetical protein